MFEDLIMTQLSLLGLAGRGGSQLNKEKERREREGLERERERRRVENVEDKVAFIRVSGVSLSQF